MLLKFTKIQKLTLTFFLFTFLINVLNAQNVNFKWAKQFGGTANDYGRSVALDASGNVYTVGFFNDVVDFDPGTGVSNLTSAGSWDIFVSKVDASGNFIWARRMGGPAIDFGYSVATDNAGNVYITGFFTGAADFDNGAGAGILTAVGSSDIFVCKLDGSGNFTWVAQLGGRNDEVAYSLSLDLAGNAYTTGYFIDTVDFDPGPGVFNLISNGISDIFVSKLDPQGNFMWAKQMGGTQSDIANSITVDAAGNIYTTGSFMSTVDFNPASATTFNLTSFGLSDIFVSKLDPSGNLMWAKQMGGDSTDAAFSIAVDNGGNVYTTGNYIDSADFDPGSSIAGFVSLSGFDIFISKLTPAGNFVWARSIGSIAADRGSSIAIGDSGSIYSTGYFQDVTDFDPGAGVTNLTSAGSFDIYISKLDSSGKFRWAKQLGGSGADQGYFITCDVSKNVYTAGSFTGTADFDPGTSVLNLTSVGANDAFIHKVSESSGVGINVSQEWSSNLNVSPNPSSKEIKIVVQQLKGNPGYTLFNAIGQTILTGILKENETDINISLLSHGLYFLEIKEDGEITRIKVVKN